MKDKYGTFYSATFISRSPSRKSLYVAVFPSVRIFRFSEPFFSAKIRPAICQDLPVLPSLTVFLGTFAAKLKAISHWTRCEKARRIVDERCFHTERETNVRLLLIHTCTLGGAKQQCIFPQICISYMDLTSCCADIYIKDFSHWTIPRECSARWHFWIKTIDPYGSIYTRRDHLRCEKARFFFHPVCRFFSPIAPRRNGPANQIWAKITCLEQLLLHKKARVVALFRKSV